MSISLKDEILANKTFAEAHWKKEIWKGALKVSPLLVSTVPFGVTFGSLAIQSGLGFWKSFAMSFIIFAGSSQLITAKLVSLHSTGFEIWSNVVLINLRHLLYSASMASRFSGLTWGKKLLVAYLLTDEAYIASINKLPSKSIHFPWAYFGAGITLWGTWQLASLAGIVFQNQLASRVSFEFLFIIMLVAVTAKSMRQPANLLTCLGVLMAFLFFPTAPPRLRIMIFSSIGLVIGFASLYYFPLKYIKKP